MTATVVRHKKLDDGFAVIVTTFLPSFAARVQQYRDIGDRGHLQLMYEAVYDSEITAENNFTHLFGEYK